MQPSKPQSTKRPRLFLLDAMDGQPAVLMVYGSGRHILKITVDGRVEPGEGLLMDEAAKAFLQECSIYVQNLERRLETAEACADILVRLERTMYKGPSGDQGLNDPFYGECLRAIRRYRAMRPPTDKVPADTPDQE